MHCQLKAFHITINFTAVYSVLLYLGHETMIMTGNRHSHLCHRKLLRSHQKAATLLLSTDSTVKCINLVCDNSAASNSYLVSKYVVRIPTTIVQLVIMLSELDSNAALAGPCKDIVSSISSIINLIYILLQKM